MAVLAIIYIHVGTITQGILLIMVAESKNDKKSNQKKNIFFSVLYMREL